MKRNGPKRTENAQPVKGALETGNAPFAKRPLTNLPFRQFIPAEELVLMLLSLLLLSLLVAAVLDYCFVLHRFLLFA
jgi:hypothetical protein